MDVDSISAKGLSLPLLLLLGFLPTFRCSGTGHFFPPSPPGDLQAEFTEDIFGTDGVHLTWEDTDRSDDIGFTVTKCPQVCIDIPLQGFTGRKQVEEFIEPTRESPEGGWLPWRNNPVSEVAIYTV